MMGNNRKNHKFGHLVGGRDGNDGRMTLNQMQQMRMFGHLVYQRVIGKDNWKWTVKVSNIN